MNEKDYDRLLMRIAENIKYYRILQGYTQEDMTAFGFDYRFYQRIESGKYSMSLHTLTRIASVFKVDVSALTEPIKKV